MYKRNNLRHLPMPYNILSLDGGGSWALIQVRCLQRLFGEAASGHEVLRHFDLVAANSGGSIVLAALVANWRLADILQLFLSQEKRRTIFAPTSKVGWRLEHGIADLLNGFIPDVGPRYSTAAKLTALEAFLGPAAGLSLEEVPAHVSGKGANKPHVLITTFDYNRQRSQFFRSDLDSYGDGVNLEGKLFHTTPPEKPGKAIRLVDAVHASSTAPVNFFDATAAVTVNGHLNYLWDGGVAGYNNPVLAAVTEALVNGVAARDVRVLSIGTGTKVFPVLLPPLTSQFDGLITRPTASDGFFTDVQKLATAVIGGPPDAASFVAFTTLNPGFVAQELPNENFVRANPSVQPQLVAGQWQAPAGFNEEDIEAIRKLELDAVESEDVRLVVRICEAWLNDDLPNQPIRSSSTLQCLIGQDTFSAVEAQFQVAFPGIVAHLATQG